MREEEDEEEEEEEGDDMDEYNDEIQIPVYLAPCRKAKRKYDFDPSCHHPVPTYSYERLCEI
jgi:hypothetical protein